MTILINGVHHSQEYVEAAVRQAEADKIYRETTTQGAYDKAYFKLHSTRIDFDRIAYAEEKLKETDHV